MFKPNVKCVITRLTGEHNAFGEKGYGEPYETECGIIRLEVSSIKTSVRADSSATRGNATEITAISRLMFVPDDILSHGDKVTVAGFELEVESVYPRFTVNGVLDHWQVDLKKWASE